MKSNEFIKRYIESHATKSKEEDALRKMCWEVKCGVCQLKVRPSHFNYFCFEVDIKGIKSTLTIRDAKSLAIYLLKWSEGVEGEHEIMDEIIKREHEIAK